MKSHEIATGGSSLISFVVLDSGESRVEKRLLPRYRGNKIFGSLLSREFEFLRAFDSPRIVKALNFSQEEDRSGEISDVLSLEALEGMNLSDVLPRLSDFSDSDRRRFSDHILMNLISVGQLLEEKAVIHGDIAPENFILTQRGLVLIDFGLARRVDSAQNFDFRIEGRESFRAPEHRADGRSSLEGDIYALGRIYEDCVGQLDTKAEHVLQMFLHERKLPKCFEAEGAEDLFAHFVSSPVRAPSRIEKTAMLRPWFLSLRPATLILLWCLVGSLIPVGHVQIRTLPATSIQIEDGKYLHHYESPTREIVLPSGRYQVRLGANRIVDIRIPVGGHLNIFEDLRKLDNL